MAITVLYGVLDRHLAQHSLGTVTAYVVYTMSNGAAAEQAHTDIPMPDLTALATAAGRATYTADDVCAWVQQNVPDLATTPVHIAVPRGSVT